jgi:hypothetical protein
MVNNQEGLCSLSLEYFTSLFTATTCDTEPILQVIKPCIDGEDNCMLVAPFNSDEFKNAVSKCILTKRQVLMV